MNALCGEQILRVLDISERSFPISSSISSIDALCDEQVLDGLANCQSDCSSFVTEKILDDIFSEFLRWIASENPYCTASFSLTTFQSIVAVDWSLCYWYNLGHPIAG